MINKKKKSESFKEFYAKLNTANGDQQYSDTTVTAEGEYAQGQDQVAEPAGKASAIGFKNNGPTFTVEKNQKDKVIDTCINFLEKLNKTGIPVNSEEKEKLLDQLQKMAKSLSSVGIEPVDIIATLKAPHMAAQYLIKGPSAPGGGGKGALQDLKDIKAGLIADDESNPGGADVTADIQNIDYNNFIVKPFLNDPDNGKDQPEGALENFMDKKGPGRPGDSRRHGIKKKSSLASLDKIVHSKTASPRKKQLAHWQANMRRGKAKKH